MLNIEKDLPNTLPATSERPFGEVKNDDVAGDGSGTPVTAVWASDLYYALYAVINDAGMLPSGRAEDVNTSDFLAALKKLISQEIDESAKSSSDSLFYLFDGQVQLLTLPSNSNVVQNGPMYHIKMNGQQISSSQGRVFELLDALPSELKGFWFSRNDSSVKTMRVFTGLFARASGGNAAAIGQLQNDELKRHSHKYERIDGPGTPKSYDVTSGSPSQKPYDDDTKDHGGDETRPVNFSQRAWYLTVVDYKAMGK
ncbi:TPA: hypothetical protein ACX6S6_001465 [Photobacterium damselae]